MDFNSSLVPPNQLPNFMPLPPYLLPQYHQANKEIQGLQQFWHKQLFDIQNTEVFKSKQQLPLARIRRIMKADKDVKMISAEAPLLFAKACEIFIQELTFRAWMCTEENKRHTLQRCDIAKAIKREDVLDFLADVVHCDHAHDNKEMNAGKEENQASVSHAASFVENTMINMGEMVASDQQFSQPQMMLPPYTSYSFPYNFHPK